MTKIIKNGNLLQVWKQNSCHILYILLCICSITISSTIVQFYFKRDKVFKSGLSKFCGRQPLKNLSRPYPFKFFKGCFPQNLLSALLNTLSQIFRKFSIFSNFYSSLWHTIKELNFWGIKFWSISQKIVPVKIIRKLSIRKIRKI